MNFKKNWNEGHAIALIFIAQWVIGISLRLYHLDYYSLWLDEIGEAVAAFSSWRLLHEIILAQLSPPLDYVLVKLASVFGRADLIVRLPAFMFSVASIPIFFFFVRTISNARTALFANMFFVFSPMAIHYGQEARMYSLFLMLSLVSYLFFARLLEEPNWKNAVTLGMVNFLVFLTHYIGLAVIGLESVIYIFLKCRKKRTLASCCCH